MIPTADDTFRSGFVALIGRPNVGKSTLMNQFIGQKIAITSPTAQTTRNRLRGILTRKEAQIIFVDTPGIHKPHHELGRILVKNATTTINAVDLIVFLVDATSPVGRGDRFIEAILAKSTTPVILGVNKMDLTVKAKRQQALDSYRELAQQHQWPLFEISAQSGQNLERLLGQVIKQLPQGPYYYPPDDVTDQPERFIIGELIREQVLRLTRDEVPHSVAITIDQLEEEPTITRILATIHVERSSQKGILIGKKGSMLKAIGSESRQQIQKLISGKVYLELFVRVQAGWRQSNDRLNDFGYSIE